MLWLKNLEMERDMNDKLTVAVSEDGLIRVYALNATNLVAKAQKIHTTSPVASVLLGRLLVGASLMSSTLKNESDTVTLQLKGNGPAKSVVAVSDARGNPRGYIGNPDLYPKPSSDGRMTVGAMVGTEGYLQVIKDLGLKEPYIGNVPLVSGEVGDEILRYFADSEQIPTACALGVLIDEEGVPCSAGGYIAQLMPGACETLAEELEEHIRALEPPSEMVAKGLDSEDMAKAVLGKFGCNILRISMVEYICNCSEERVLRVIASLGASALDEMIAEGKGAQVSCHFCGRVYEFSTQDLIDIKSRQ